MSNKLRRVRITRFYGFMRTTSLLIALATSTKLPKTNITRAKNIGFCRFGEVVRVIEKAVSTRKTMQTRYASSKQRVQHELCAVTCFERCHTTPPKSKNMKK